MRPVLLMLAAMLSLNVLCAEPIPVTKATTLSGRPLKLPADLTAPVNVLIVGFSQKSAEPMKETTIKLKQGFAGKPVPVYLLPNIAGAPGFVRGLIVRGMKSDTPKTEWDTFAPVTEKDKEWKRLAGFRGPDDAYVLLVDRQ